MSTLEDALNRIYADIHKSGIPLCINPITLLLWLDTDQKTCVPIIGTMKISFKVNEKKVFDIFRSINNATPIYAIKVHGITFHITKIEEFMEKRCEV